MKLSIIDAVPVESGGFCKGDCHGEPTVAIDLGKNWDKYVITWAQLKELGSKGRVPFDPRRITSLQFSVDAGDTPFDMWIDDVRFTKQP